MPNSVGLIPRNRLKWIPKHLRLAHEYCFFLHDENARMLVEYEGAKAHFVNYKFRSQSEADKFHEMVEGSNAISAMRSSGFLKEAQRVIINQVTMGMVSDCLHHIYEGLRCLEKRKTIVAFNLFRKPLTDNLLYLSWILGNEEDFYEAFSTKSPGGITSSLLKSRRTEIISQALKMTEISDILTTDFIDEMLFSRKNESGFQKLFQHAVHLVTVQHTELKTTSENFNFIFKNYSDDDLYELTYDSLPHILLYLSHVNFSLFERMLAPQNGPRTAFFYRSILGLYLVEGQTSLAIDRLTELVKGTCDHCGKPIEVTPHNAGRILLSESYRCVGCRNVRGLPFSWQF